MNVDSSMCASSGKASHWEQIDWPNVQRQVRRLQARIVKATRRENCRDTGSAHAGLRSGLSRMRGKSQVRFLGERAAATPLAYPTSASESFEPEYAREGNRTLVIITKVDF